MSSNVGAGQTRDVQLVEHNGHVSLATRLTPAVREIFLAELTRTANITRAASVAGVTRTAAYELRSRDPAFDAACVECLESATDRLEQKVRKRAEDGTERGVWYKGERVGAEVETHDILSMFMLKAHRPNVYRQDVAVQVGLSVAHTASMTDAQLEALVARQLRDEHVIDADTFNVIKQDAQHSRDMQVATEHDASTIDAVQRSVVYGEKGPQGSKGGGGGLVTRSEGDPKERQIGRASCRERVSSPV